MFNTKIGNFVNAVLRAYLRNPQINYPENAVQALALRYSFPEDLIINWINLWGEENCQLLCEYFNENPQLSIRVNKFATEPHLVKAYFVNPELTFLKVSLHQMFSQLTRLKRFCKMFLFRKAIILCKMQPLHW